MIAPQQMRVAGHGTELALAVWPGEGLPILCIHGLTANSRCWLTFANGLLPGCSLIAPDLRGRGASGKPASGYSIFTHCLDLLALLDELELERVHLLGHSLGAAIAMVFAATHPDRVDHLVLVDGAGKLNKSQIKRVVAAITPSVERLGKVYPSIEAYLDTLRQVPYFASWTETHEAYFRYEMEEAAGGVISRTRPEHISEELGNLLSFEVSDYYEKITCPTLILRACRGLMGDAVLLPENAITRMVRAIANVWVVSLPKDDHYAIVFNENRVRDQVIQCFLQTL